MTKTFITKEKLDIIILNESRTIWNFLGYRNYFSSGSNKKINVNILVKECLQSWRLSKEEDINLIILKVGSGANWVIIESIYLNKNVM